MGKVAEASKSEHGSSTEREEEENDGGNLKETQVALSSSTRKFERSTRVAVAGSSEAADEQGKRTHVPTTRRSRRSKDYSSGDRTKGGDESGASKDSDDRAERAGAKQSEMTVRSSSPVRRARRFGEGPGKSSKQDVGAEKASEVDTESRQRRCTRRRRTRVGEEEEGADSAKEGAATQTEALRTTAATASRPPRSARAERMPSPPPYKDSGRESVSETTEPESEAPSRKRGRPSRPRTTSKKANRSRGARHRGRKKATAPGTAEEEEEKGPGVGGEGQAAGDEGTVTMTVATNQAEVVSEKDTVVSDR